MAKQIYCYSIGIADKRGTGDRKDVSEVIVGTRDVSSIRLAMDHLVPDTLRNFPKKHTKFFVSNDRSEIAGT